MLVVVAVAEAAAVAVVDDLLLHLLLTMVVLTVAVIQQELNIACHYLAVEDDTYMYHTFGGTSVVTNSFDRPVTGM
jgi:hypothetical protein